jgi:hypothetical protein
VVARLVHVLDAEEHRGGLHQPVLLPPLHHRRAGPGGDVAVPGAVHHHLGLDRLQAGLVGHDQAAQAVAGDDGVDQK